MNCSALSTRQVYININSLEDFFSITFSLMTQANHSQVFDQTSLLRKPFSQVNQIRICNCPCTKQIEQNQRIIQLQREYTRTLQLQNLRRNQERIGLQSEISSLKFQLEQPYKQKEELNEKIIHFRKKYEESSLKIKNLQSLIHQKDVKLNLAKDELYVVKNQNEKLQFQSNLNSISAQELKSKLNQMYHKLNLIAAKQRKNSQLFLNKNQENLDQIIYNFNNKWQKYGQDLQKKHAIEFERLQAKHKTQLQSLKVKVNELEIKLKQKSPQISFLMLDKQQLQSQIVTSSNEIKSLRAINGKSMQSFEKQNQTKLEQRIRYLQKQLSELERQKLKFLERQREFLRNQHLQLDIDLNQKCAKIRKNDSLCKQTQTQSSYLYDTEQQTSLICLQAKYDKNVEQLKLRNNQVSKLQQKVQSLSKIRQLYQKKQQQLKLHREEVSKYSLDKNIQICKNENKSYFNKSQAQLDRTLKSILQNQGLKKLFLNALLIQESQFRAEFNAEFKAKFEAEVNPKLLSMQQTLNQKDQHIICLEQANSSLKKLKIQSLNDNAKILTLQKQNNQMRKALGISHNQKLSPYRLAKSDFKNHPFSKSNVSNSSKKAYNDNTKSAFKIRVPFHERSYLTCKNSETVKSSDSEAPQFMLLERLNYQADKAQFQGRKQYKLRVRRHETYESEGKQRKKVNFCLQVPRDQYLKARSQSEENMTTENTFKI